MPPPPATLRGAAKIKARLREEAGLAKYVLPPRESSSDESCDDESVAASQRKNSPKKSRKPFASPTSTNKSQYVKRVKKFKPLDAAFEQCAEAAAATGIEVVLPSFETFGGAEFDSQETFLEAFREYCAVHNVAYRKRQSQTRAFRNAELLKMAANSSATRQKRKAMKNSVSEMMVAKESQALESELEQPPKRESEDNAGKDAESLREAVAEPTQDAEPEHDVELLPPSISHWFCQYECVHQGKQKSRTTGKRFHALKRFTNCEARITARAEVITGTKKWRIVIEKENTKHNHLCTEPIFWSYITSSKIDDQALFGEIASQIAVDGNPRIIRDRAAARMSAPFTRRQYSNFKHYQLGAVKAGENLEELVKTFCSIQGNWCEVLREPGSNLVRGLVFQTAAQRAQFKKYGDSLVLDWTHNTNDLGFHLGSLLATSATGKGLPVLDFLCLSQGTVMLTEVLEHFVANNPGAVERVRSFVIDKDLAEWAAIRAVFPRSVVVLCQFHVVKWFKGCMTNTDYHIEAASRKPAQKILRSMVYATSVAQFKRYKGRLRRLLNKERHAPFHAYMKRRWYAMKAQWTDCKRGKVYTAGNTTSNRLESHWKHLKAGIGKKRRIDSCCQSIVMRGRAVLARERDELVEHQGKTRVFEGVHKFVHPLLRCLSASRVMLVRRQWEKFSSHPARFQVHAAKGGEHVSELAANDTTTYTVSLSTQPSIKYTVVSSTTSEWSCTCRFAVTHRLPCRHQFFVGFKLQELAAFPVSALALRWNMNDAVTLVDELELAVHTLAAVRVPMPGFDLPSFIPPRPVSVAERETLPSRPKAVSHVRLRTNERSEALVMDALQKRNHVRGQLSRVLLPMMELSTPLFWAFSEKLEVVLSDFLASLAEPPQRQVDVASASIPAAEVEVVDRAACEPLVACTGSTSNSADPESSLSREPGSETSPHEGPRLETAVLAHLVHGEDESFEDSEDDLDAYHPSENEAAYEDEDEHADEEDFDDVDDAVTQPQDASDPVVQVEDVAQDEALLCDQMDLRDLVDLGGLQPRVDAAIFDGFAFDSPQRHCFDVGRFPSLLDEVRDSQLDAIMLDSDREDEFCVGSAANEEYVAAVEAAVMASTQRLVGPVSPMAMVVDRTATQHRPVDASTNENDEKTDQARTSKRKADTEMSTAEDFASTVKTPRVNEGLQISQFLPTARRGTPKQRQQQSGGGNRVAAIVSRSECPVLVADFVDVLQFSKLQEFEGLVRQYPVLYKEAFFETRAVKVSRVSGPVPDLNFFVSSVVEERIRAAVNDVKSAEGVQILSEVVSAQAQPCGESPSAVVSTHAQLAGKVEGMAQVLNEDGLLALATVSSLRVLHSRYATDLDWINNDYKWQKVAVSSDFHFLDEYADECNGEVSKMREKVVGALGSYTLRTTLSVPVRTLSTGDIPTRRTPSVSLPELLGRLSGDEWLNDTILNFALHILASDYCDVSVIDSLTRNSPVAPGAFLTLQRVVIFPVNIENEHWCVICVQFDWDNLVSTATAYDPMGKGNYDKRIEEAWATWCHPLLHSWLKRDQRRVLSVTNSPEITQLPSISLQLAVAGTPKQDDGYSCGIYCIAQAVCYMTDDFELHKLATIPPSLLQVMRLRLMYTIFTKAVVRNDEEGVRKASAKKDVFRGYVGEAEGTLAQRPARAAPKKMKKCPTTPEM